MQYRIKNGAPPHFIGGHLYKAGEVVESDKPGTWLEPIETLPESPVEAPKRRGRPPKIKEPEDVSTGA